MKRRKFIFFIYTILFLFVTINIFAYITIQLKLEYTRRYHPKAPVYVRQGLDSKRYLEELTKLCDSVELSPYSWYRLTKNFKGFYFKTNNGGFRISDSANISNKGWAMYGGSTMFGVTNSVNGTIPSIFKKNCSLASSYNVLNFGIPGYSTQSEIPIFLETIRNENYKIKRATFYDGVNDVLRYIEKLQDENNEELYEVFGYPFYDMFSVAALNYINKKNGSLAFTLPIYDFYYKFKRKFTKTNNINFMLKNKNEYNLHAKKIVDIYEANINLISNVAQANNIHVQFIWQPTLFTTNNEKILLGNKDMLEKQPVIAELFKAVNDEIKNRNSLKHVVNLTESFNALPDPEHFVDAVHVSDKANELIAADICKNDY